MDYKLYYVIEYFYKSLFRLVPVKTYDYTIKSVPIFR